MLITSTNLDVAYCGASTTSISQISEPYQRCWKCQKCQNCQTYDIFQYRPNWAVATKVLTTL